MWNFSFHMCLIQRIVSYRNYSRRNFVVHSHRETNMSLVLIKKILHLVLVPVGIQ